MNRNNEFLKNTIILFIGKIATQFISFLLLPLYTRYLLTDDYGTVDLIQTYITLFIPLLTLRLDSAIFRFLVDKRDNKSEKEKIITNTIFLLAISLISTTIIALLLYFVVNIKYYIYVIINLIILMISSILLQLLRGLGKTKEYSIASIITAITTLIANLILIIVLNCHAESILISSSLANIICIIYIIIKTKLFKYIKKSTINKKEINNLLKYSMPMIPNALSWWIVGVSDRTIISYFLGVAYNGIYAISCKFSNVLNSVFMIFNMSWQETASLHINDKDKDEFFSKMINSQLIFFSSMSLIIIGILPIIYNILIGKSYISSYKFIPILLYANNWNVLIGLLGGIYVAQKKTKEIMNTTIASAIINLFSHLILIKFIGLYAACISTLLAYIIMGIYRYIDCKKYITLKLDIKKYIIVSIIFFICSIIYLKNIMILNVLNIIFIIIFSIFINKQTIEYLYNQIKNKLKKL